MNFDNTMVDVTKTYTNIGVAPLATASNQPVFSIDAVLPSLLVLVGVVTGVISIMNTLNKGQEEKINMLMTKIDDLDARLDTVNFNFGNLNEKYATKQELIASEHRIEGYFNRMDGKFDAVILGCKI